MPRAAGGDSGGAGAGGALDGSSEGESERVRASRRTEEEIGGSEAMTWAMFYLVCFLVGVTLSALSFLGGSFHLPHFHVHVPRVDAGGYCWTRGRDDRLLVRGQAAAQARSRTRSGGLRARGSPGAHQQPGS